MKSTSANENWCGTGYEQHPRHQDSRPGRSAALKSDYGLDNHGLTQSARRVLEPPDRSAVRRDRVPPRSPDHAGRAPLSPTPANIPARSANDKFVVREATTEDKIWWGEYNRPFSPDKFNDLYNRLQGFLQGRDVFVQDCLRGRRSELPDADPHHHRACLAQPLCAQHVHSSARRTRSTAAMCRNSPSSAPLRSKEFRRSTGRQPTRSSS